MSVDETPENMADFDVQVGEGDLAGKVLIRVNGIFAGPQAATVAMAIGDASQRATRLPYEVLSERKALVELTARAACKAIDHFCDDVHPEERSILCQLINRHLTAKLVDAVTGEAP